jgi:hypothetical protein
MLKAAKLSAQRQKTEDLILDVQEINLRLAEGFADISTAYADLAALDDNLLHRNRELGALEKPVSRRNAT